PIIPALNGHPSISNIRIEIQQHSLHIIHTIKWLRRTSNAVTLRLGSLKDQMISSPTHFIHDRQRCLIIVLMNDPHEVSKPDNKIKPSRQHLRKVITRNSHINKTNANTMLSFQGDGQVKRPLVIVNSDHAGTLALKDKRNPSLSASNIKPSLTFHST